MSVPRASKPRTQPGLEGEEVSFQNLHSVFSEVSAKLPPHAMRGLIISPSGRKCWTSDQSRQERDQAQTSTWEDFQKGGQWINMSISANIALAIHWAFKKIRYRKNHFFGQVRKFLREAEENGESEDLNGKGAGPADDKCFLCQKVILMLIMMLMLIMLMWWW